MKMQTCESSQQQQQQQQQSAHGRRRVCVVGSGIAGLSAAYHLAKHGGDAVHVVVYEKEETIGGHEKPVTTPHGTVDLGYMVLNKHTYPNLLRFYEQHHVPLQATDMGFSIDNPTISWCLSSSLPQQLQLLRHPKLPSFVKDKTRFHSDALAFLERYRDADAATAPALSLLEFCTKHGYGAAFMEGWLKPFCEAVWSAPKSEAMAMDAYSILAFLRNHGFLTWSTPQWYTPRGRTTLTLKLFRHLFEHLGVEVHTANPVHAVRRQEDGTVAVTSETQGERVFDDVVLATPSGLALELLEAPTQDDVDALSGFKCSSNTVLLHTNPDLMPRDRALWSSWNVIEREETGDRPLLTYWVKPLQHIKSDNVFISLNPPAYMLEHKQRRRDVLMEWRTQHPMMTVDALRCQRRVHEHHQGKGGVWYAGAYLHYGFHEDGFRSGIEVARTLLKDTSIPLLPISGDAFHPTHFLLKGSTTHVRFNPSTGKVVHSFRYPLEYHCINVDAGFQTWWGGLFRRDYFGDQADSLGIAVRKKVLEETGSWPCGCVDAITVPRHYGYSFNPISLFLCWDSAQRKRVEFVVSQVTNTPWGENTVQVLDLRDKILVGGGDGDDEDDSGLDGDRGEYVIDKIKTLHVSPFNPNPDGQATWRYRLKKPQHGLPSFRLTVEMFEDQACTRKKVLATMDLSNAGPMSTRRQLLPPLPRPLMVQWWIHLQAAVLFLFKRAKYHDNLSPAHITRPSHTDPFELLLTLLSSSLLSIAIIVAILGVALVL